MSAQPQVKTYLTPEEYLEIERQAEYKSEYWNGEIFAMAGASERHVLIVTNVVAELRTQLKGRPCKVYSTDMRVNVDATGLYTYPDIVALCGKSEFDEGEMETLLNPTVIIEVLSPSTEAYDRGMKFEHYRTLTSLADYLLISQQAPKIEHFVRQSDERWILSESSGPDDTIEIASIQCSLPLPEVYDKVEFPPREEGGIMRRVQ